MTRSCHIYAYSYPRSPHSRYTATSFNALGTPPPALNPIGHPAWPGTTLCGPSTFNWLTYSLGRYNTSLELAWNFASAGATVDPSVVPTFWPWIVPVTQQIALFQQLNVYAFEPDDAMFALWIGITVTIPAAEDSYAFDFEDRGAAHAQAISVAVVVVHHAPGDASGRILFLALPRVDCLPLVRISHSQPLFLLGSDAYVLPQMVATACRGT